MEIVYHGTSSVVVPLVERQGLLPDAPKVYCEPTFPYESSNVSFGGIYVSRKRKLAEEAADYAVELRGGTPVVYAICMNVKDKSVFLDEDEIILMVEEVTETYSWVHFTAHEGSLFFNILQHVNDSEYDKNPRYADDIYYQRCYEAISTYDYAVPAAELIKNIRPDIDKVLLEDMLESVANLLTLFGVHMLGRRFAYNRKESKLPEYLTGHFENLVRAVNLFSGLFPETKFLKKWDTFRIMCPVDFGSADSAHWINGMEYERQLR